MATERIDIVITERGSRLVRRNLDSLATAAERADSEFNALRAAVQRINPTTQLNQLLQQIHGVRDALAGSRTAKNWMKVSIEEANAGIVQMAMNLRTIRTAMGQNVDWAVNAELRQAEAELNDIITKLQRVRDLQMRQNNLSGNLRNTGGVAPYVPRVVTLPDVGRFARDAELAARNADRLGPALDRAGAAAKGAHSPFMLLNRYVGAFGSILIANRLIEFADAATVVRNRVDIVSESVGEAETAMEELFAIARRTRSPVEELSTLYQKAMMASSELGVDQREVLRFVEAVGMGLAVQGSSANTARGALIQLSQAIGTDIVRAEEFNSILEGAYPIALAAARGIDEAGGSVAKLRRMVIDGQITSEQFFNAIMSQYPQIADMFERTNPTVSQAFTVLRNSVIDYIQNSEEAKAISGALADAIILIADNIEPIADALMAIGAAMAIAFVGSKVALVGTMATNMGALGAATQLLRGALGFMGGPIVGGLALLGGAAYFVYQNMDDAASEIERMNRAMDAGVTALQQYNEHVQMAKDEQEELGGVINLTTERLLRQSRVQLQQVLRELQDAMQDIQDDLEGNGMFDMDTMRAAIAKLRGPGFNIGSGYYGNAELENVGKLLEAIEDGSGEIQPFVDAVRRLQGVGPEVTRALEDLKTAMDALPENPADEPSQQASLWLDQAQAQLTNIAELIGGFDEEVASVANAEGVTARVEALQALSQALQTAQNAAGFISRDSWITDTVDLLEKLNEARQQEALMLEALGANAETLQQLTNEAERFRTPMEGSAGAAEDTEASLDRINFAPLQQGARGFADELIRAAAAVELIRGRSQAVSIPSGPQIIDASYTPDAGNGTMAFMASSSSTGLANDQQYGLLLAALADYGVPTLNTTLSTMGGSLDGGAGHRNFGADTNIVDAVDRTGQSEEYLSVLQSINQELDSRYEQLTLNNSALETEKLLYEATARARQEGVILNQQDIQMIRERVEALSELERKVKLINEVGDAVFNNLESALNEFVQTGTFNFSEFAKSVIADLAKIAIQMMIIAPLKNFFGGILGNAFGLALPGHNEGADFMVGGTGGVDKNVVAFRASRGERVQVTPAGKTGNNDGMTVNFNISTPDVEGFRRSETQMAARAQRMMARGQRNS